MSINTAIKKKIKELKERFPGMDEERLEKELIPLRPEEEIQPITVKKKKVD
jgi:hypothetical protein